MLTPAHEPRIVEHGPVAEHDVLCWLCGVRPAVYDTSLPTSFLPCWDCQVLLRSHRSVWRRLLDLVRGRR